MAIDKNKITEAAIKYIQKGQNDKAIKEYKKILLVDPKDARTLQKLGELYAKLGDTAQAIDNFLKVAEQYTADGFLLKAIAMYRQIIKLAPERIDIRFILAQLHQQNGLLGDAMAQYQMIVSHYESTGNMQACMETLQKIIELAPDNTVMRIKLAELYVRQSMTDMAIQELMKVREQFKQNSRTDDYLKITERIVYLDPSKLDLVRELASSYLALGEAQRALAKLQICFRANPKDIDTLSMLARAFQMSGETLKTASIYKEMARIYRAQNQSRLEKDAWNKVLQLVPSDRDAQRHLGIEKPAVRMRPAAAPKAAPQRPAAAGSPSGSGVKSPFSPKPAAAASPSAPKSAAAGSGLPPNLVRLLNETDVYIKYGLTDKALDHLRKIFEQFPDSVDAQEKTAQVYVKRKDPAGTMKHVTEAIRLALASGDKARAKAVLDRFSPSLSGQPGLSALETAIQTGNMAAAAATTPAAVPPAIPAAQPAAGAHQSISDKQHVPASQSFAPRAAAAGSPQKPNSGDKRSKRFMSQLPTADEGDIDWDTLDDEDSLDSGTKTTAARAVPKSAAHKADIPTAGEDIDWASLEEEEDEEPKKPAASSKASADGSSDEIDWSDFNDEDAPPAAASSNKAEAPKAKSSSPEEDIDWSDLNDEAEANEVKAKEKSGNKAAAAKNKSVSPEEDIDWSDLNDDGDSETKTSEKPQQADAPKIKSASAEDDIDWSDLNESDTESASKPANSAVQTPQSSASSAASGSDDIAWEDLNEDTGNSAASAQKDSAPAQTVHSPASAAGTSGSGKAISSIPVETASFDQPKQQSAPAVQQQVSPAAAMDNDALMIETLDEAAFFINQGNLVEARDVLMNAQLAYPNSPRVAEMVSILEAHERYYAEQQAYMAYAQQQAAYNNTQTRYNSGAYGRYQSMAPAPSEQDLFSQKSDDDRVAIQSSGIADGQVVSFDDVLSEFKKGLEQVVRPEDVDTHYDLGLTYKEMELFSEAISEFRAAAQAAKGQPKEIDCMTMIAICQAAAGQTQEAEATFKSGLALPAMTPIVEIGLRFELACLYENLGKNADALNEFTKVAQLDGRYRDVQNCIARVRAKL